MKRGTKADVCFVLPGLARTPVGGYRVVYEYANLLSERGYAVTIAHMRMSHMRGPALREHAMRVAYAVFRGRRPKWFDLDSRVIVMNHFAPDARRVPSARTLVATSVGTAPVVAKSVRLHNADGLYFIQHVEDFTVPLAEVERTWQLPLRRLVVSRWLHDELAARGLDAALIENGVDRRTFHPISGTAPSGILAMVSDQAFKRTDLVVDTFRRLAEVLPDLPLRTFGACDRPIGLPSAAEHFREPTRQELADLYRQSAIYICASDKEGFGLPVLEAMSSGCAVVTTDNGGVPAFAGDAVLTVPANSSVHLHRGVTTLLEDEDVHARYRMAGLRRAEELDAARSCDRLESILVNGWRVRGG